MADLPAGLAYGTVSLRLVEAVPDTLGDAGVLPDARPVTGAVTFIPTPGVIYADGATPPATILPLGLPFQLSADGVLQDANGSAQVSLLASDSPNVRPGVDAEHPQGWTWTVHFNLGGPVTLPSFSFYLPAGTNVDLSTVAPVQASNGALMVKGDTGPASELSIGTVTGGDDAAATLTGDAPAQVLSLVLPRGLQGDPGGPGPANQLSIGTVTDGPSAAAGITGTPPAQVLDLVLPQGDPGPANTLAIGTVGSGTTAAATITGTPPAQTLDLVLPKGDQGTPGTVQDTDWRDITTGLTAPWTVTSPGSINRALLRRVGNKVYFWVRNLAGGTSNTTLYTLPDGFKLDVRQRGLRVPQVSNGGSLGVLSIDAATVTYVLVPSGQAPYIYAEWLTADAWPTTLPGASA